MNLKPLEHRFDFGGSEGHREPENSSGEPALDQRHLLEATGFSVGPQRTRLSLHKGCLDALSSTVGPDDAALAPICPGLLTPRGTRSSTDCDSCVTSQAQRGLPTDASSGHNGPTSHMTLSGCENTPTAWMLSWVFRSVINASSFYSL